MPCFRGTRVPVDSLIDYFEARDMLDEFLDNFPSVETNLTEDQQPTTGIQSVDGHFPLHRPGDFNAPIPQRLRNCRHLPRCRSNTSSFRQKGSLHNLQARAIDRGEGQR